MSRALNLVFENQGEIDPRLVMLIGVNVKEGANPIGFFGTGLKYAVACVVRWGGSITIQSGEAEFSFVEEKTEIRGRSFGVINMCSRYDRATLGFTTELGKRWEPWMVYRELWCNAHDEPSPSVYQTNQIPLAKAGFTRVVVECSELTTAHETCDEFILQDRKPLHVVDGLEIYEGPGNRIFYRGIAVQTPDKPGLYTYNITEQLYLTEDRTAGSWATDSIIARGLTLIDNRSIIDETLTASSDMLESRLDYDYARNPSELWLERAQVAVASRPLDVPSSVRGKFVSETASVCPTCGRPVE